MRSVLIVALQIYVSAVNALRSTPLRPPMYPLAVRSPYLSTWIQGKHEGIKDQSPEFWNGQILGWTGLLRDGKVIYSLFGATPAEIKTRPAKQLSQHFTPDSTSFRFAAGRIVVELVFRNPLTPSDYKRQGIPFSYLDVILSSFSTRNTVELYFDINGAWLSGDSDNFISWETGKASLHNHAKHTRKTFLHSQRIRRTSQLLFSENGDMAEWGELVWSTDGTDNLTMSAGYSTHSTRKHFAKFGNLSCDVSSEFRPINLDEPVFAFAKSFHASKRTQSALFTIGLVQEQVLQVNMASGYKPARPIYQRHFNTTDEMLTWHFQDYENANQGEFAKKVIQDSNKIDPEYAKITAISTLQAMGGTQLVINEDDQHGEPYLWMKEISSDGNMQTSDVMYPAIPFFLYANSKLAVAMLEPMLQHQESGLYPHKYAMHDMGSSYPNATGHPDGQDEYMPVEESGNNLIMILAAHDGLISEAKNARELRYARQWLSSHYKIAGQWTQYLIDFGLVTEEQLSTDDFAGRLANQTNLAVKAIVGIKAMSVIARISGHLHEADRYDNISQDYVRQWLVHAYEVGVPFAKLAYQWKGSWGSLYNLYPDELLRLNTFPRIVYEQQDSWYSKILEPYGLPLDSRHLYTKSDWQMFIASFSSPALASQLYKRIATWINETETHKPLIDLYDTIGGANAINMFTNRPVVGGHLAHLAMNKFDATRDRISQSRSMPVVEPHQKTLKIDAMANAHNQYL